MTSDTDFPHQQDFFQQSPLIKEDKNYKWKHYLVKKIGAVFKRLHIIFGNLLSSLVLLLVVSIIIVSLIISSDSMANNSYVLFLIQVLFLLIFAISFYYLARGIVGALLIKRRGGGETSLVNAKKMILRGIIGMAVLFLLYFLLSEIAGLFGHDVPNRIYPRM